MTKNLRRILYYFRYRQIVEWKMVEWENNHLNSRRRATPAMGTLLAVHLGLVAGLFITMPYGKFIHAVFRYTALIRNAMEQSREEN